MPWVNDLGVLRSAADRGQEAFREISVGRSFLECDGEVFRLDSQHGFGHRVDIGRGFRLNFLGGDRVAG
jgi:hypothetical protein